MILHDTKLLELGPTLLTPFDPSLVNPASIDIRVGDSIMVEMCPAYSHTPVNKESFREVRLGVSKDTAFNLYPGRFCLAETLERITVPNGYAIELRLKSSRAREGWNHSLAFWFDPGWDGIGTLELKNELIYHVQPLYKGLKIGQIIVHRLEGPSEKPYNGNYHRAAGVQTSVHI